MKSLRSSLGFPESLSVIVIAAVFGVTLANPVLVPCGLKCKTASVFIQCEDMGAFQYHTPSCFFCDNNVCTVGGDPYQTCIKDDEMMTSMDVYTEGVEFCRACSALTEYVEGLAITGTFIVRVDDVDVFTCVFIAN